MDKTWWRVKVRKREKKIFKWGKKMRGIKHKFLIKNNVFKIILMAGDINTFVFK